jgi:hypothetical protein
MESELQYTLIYLALTAIGIGVWWATTKGD